MGIAVQINKKQIIIVTIVLLALLFMFIFLKTGKQDGSLINEQNSTISGKIASVWASIRSGQNDSSGTLNSIQGGQTDTLEILTNTPPDSFMNLSGEALVMNNIWNRNSSNNSQRSGNLLNSNQGNSNFFNSSQGNSNFFNGIQGNFGQGNSNLPSSNQANNSLSNNSQGSSNLFNSSQENNNISNNSQGDSNLPNSNQTNSNSENINLVNTSQGISNISNSSQGDNNLPNSNQTNGNSENINLVNSSQGDNNLPNSNQVNSNSENIDLVNSSQGDNNFNNSFGNINLAVNLDNENNELSFLEEKEIEVATVTPYIPPPIPGNMGLVPPEPPSISSAPNIPSNMGLLSGGTFYMGSPELEEERQDDETQQRVTIKPFYIGKYEVTQKEYEEVMKKNPSLFVNPDFPVENVSWFDAIEYCNNRSLRDGLPPAYNVIVIGDVRLVSWNRDSKGYRLPTEAEWEYACRAGTVTPFNTGETISRRQANFFSDGPRKVGSFRPNNWGLYDMHGNVSEWCWNWYLEEYAVETMADANYLHLEGHRVFRGGSWFTLTMRLRSAFRDHYFPNYKSMNIGFRIARNPD